MLIAEKYIINLSSLVILRMGEIIARNMLSWLELLIVKLSLLHLVGGSIVGALYRKL